MGSGVDALIAAGPRPVQIDPTLAMQRRVQLGELQAQQAERQAQAQSLQAQTQERQATFQDQLALRKAFTDSGGDFDKLSQLAIQYGARVPAVQAAQAAHEQLVTSLLSNEKTKNELAVSHHQQLSRMVDGISDLPPDQRDAAMPGFWQKATQYLPGDELASAQQNFGSTDDRTLNAFKTTLDYGGNLAKEAVERQNAASSAKQAATAAGREQLEAEKQAAELPGIQAEAQRKQLVTAAMKAAQADPTKGAAAIDAAVPPNVDQQANTSYKAAWTAAMQAGSPEAAARIVEAAAQHSASLSPAKRQSDIDKAVATAKAEMPVKVATAAAESKARMDAMTPPDQALDMMAEQTLAGKSVPMGRNPAMAGKIYERAAQLARDRGLNDQQAVMEGFAAKANQTALTSVTKQYETLKPFAEMAEKNADVLEQKMKNVTNLGAPFLNTPIRDIEQKFLGNNNVSAFRAAMMPVQADFARILNSPTGGGVLSDNARHEMQAAISPGATPGMIKSALDVFRTDARNRKASYEQQLQDLKGKTVVGGVSAPATGSPATGDSQSHALPKIGDTYNGHKVLKVEKIQ